MIVDLAERKLPDFDKMRDPYDRDEARRARREQQSNA
jgi:hypothetical protein